MAMGVVQFSIGLLSNIPCPHIFSNIIDGTCIVWNKVCGTSSYCSLYNSNTFRKLFFGNYHFFESACSLLNLFSLKKHRCLMLYHASRLRYGHGGVLQVTPNRH